MVDLNEGDLAEYLVKYFMLLSRIFMDMNEESLLVSSVCVQRHFIAKLLLLLLLFRTRCWSIVPNIIVFLSFNKHDKSEKFI